jgi:hypothetical protein
MVLVDNNNGLIHPYISTIKECVQQLLKVLEYVVKYI